MQKSQVSTGTKSCVLVLNVVLAQRVLSTGTEG